MYNDNPLLNIQRFISSILINFKKNPIGYRIIRGAVWNISGSVISKGFTLASFIFVARYIGKQQFGEFGIIQSTVSMFQVFASFGVGLTTTKFISELRDSNPDRAGRIIGFSYLSSALTGMTMAIFLFFSAPWLSDHLLNAGHLSGLFRLSAVLLFIGALNGSQTGILAGFEAFNVIAKINFVVGIVSFPLIVGGAYLGGLAGIILGLIAVMFLTLLLNLRSVRIKSTGYGIGNFWKDCLAEKNIIWQFSLPAAISAALVVPINWVCNAILVNQANGYSEMGIYNAANQWYNALLFVPLMISQAVLPILSERYNKNAIHDAMKILLYTVKLNFGFILPLVLFISLLSPWIMGLYGEGFAESWPILIVVLITAFISSILIPVGNMIAASGKMWLGLVMNLGWALVFILSTIYIIDLGALGLAIARAFAYFIHSVWTFLFAYNLLKNR